MKKPYLKFIIFPLLAAGFIACKHNSLHQEIKSKAIDNEISESEFKELLKYAASDSKLSKYTGPGELYNYIVEDLAKSDTPVKIWNPNPQTESTAFNVNVYLENSLSIDGYVKETDMKNSVYEMLGNIKSVCDSLNLSYINNKILNTVKNAQSADSKDYILNLTPAMFKSKGGNRGVSDMADIITHVLAETNKTNLSVLVSDFVFSPGSGIDAERYLKIQKTNIRDVIKDKLKNQGLAIAVYQMTAAFDGDYYDHNNKTEKYKGKRPYYIWFIGAESQVKTLINKQVIRNSDYLNRVVFVSTKEVAEVKHQIVKLEKTGNFSLSSKEDEINKAVADNGSFGFSIAVDFSGSLRDKKYFTDSLNYRVNDNSYTVSARLLSDDEKAEPALTGFTHLITLKSKKLSNQELKIKIISKQPSWISSSNSTNDSNINNNKEEESKTFGLNYLMGGVAEAFNYFPDESDNIITLFKIKINK